MTQYMLNTEQLYLTSDGAWTYGCQLRGTERDGLSHPPTATAVLVLLGVSVFVFLMLHIIFPSPAIDVLGPHANKFSIAQWNRQHGFDDPWFVQYLRYMDQLLHGNSATPTS